MKSITGKTWLSLALLFTLALAVPSQSYGLSRLATWWNSLRTAPVVDVEFENVTTTEARLLDIVLRRFAVRSNERIVFDTVSVGAAVSSSSVLTIDQIVLEEGEVVITIDIDPATLKTDVLGSSFRTNATATVETEAGTIEINGQVRGRITLQNGVYQLTGAFAGAATTNLGSGNLHIQAVAVPFIGTGVSTTTTM